MTKLVEFLTVVWPGILFFGIAILIYWLQLYVVKNIVFILVTKTDSQWNLPFSFRLDWISLTKESVKMASFYNLLTINAFVITYFLLSSFFKNYFEDPWSCYQLLKGFILSYLLCYLIIVPSFILFEKLKGYSERLFIGMTTFIGLTGIIVFIFFNIYFSFSLTNITTYFVIAFISGISGMIGLMIALSYLIPFIKKRKIKPSLECEPVSGWSPSNNEGNNNE